MIGKRFGRLTVTSVARIGGRPHAVCRCDCGSERAVDQRSLNIGVTRSCGCIRREQLSARRLKHGEANPWNQTVEYRTWVSMKRRCYTAEGPDRKHYRDRGITVCDRWRDSFDNFLADMGRRPSPQHSIDRIDNDGNYEPGNCRWATKREQNCNSRNNRRLTAFGKTQPISEWAREAGISRSVLEKRLASGWTIEDALQRPLRKVTSPKKQRDAVAQGSLLS